MGPQNQQDGLKEQTMLRLGNQIRLTAREVARFTEITGVAPVNLRSIADLDAYVEQCKQHFSGTSKDARFLRWLIERERSSCLRALA